MWRHENCSILILLIKLAASIFFLFFVGSLKLLVGGGGWVGGLFVQMDYVVNEAFKVLDADAGGSVDRQDFDKSLLEVIGSIMLQLSGKPIGVQSSGIVPPQRATSGIMPF